MGRTDLRVAAVPPLPNPLPQDFYHIYKYIHKYITYNSESGRQTPHRGSADTVTRLRNSRKGNWAPRTGLQVFSCPGYKSRLSPPLSSGFSLSSMESCRRQVWRLATWAAGSWAGCVDPSHSEEERRLSRLEQNPQPRAGWLPPSLGSPGHPVEGDGVTAVSEAAGGRAGCARMVGAHNQGLLQGPGAQWSPRPRAG